MNEQPVPRPPPASGAALSAEPDLAMCSLIGMRTIDDIDASRKQPKL